MGKPGVTRSQKGGVTVPLAAGRRPAGPHEPTLRSPGRIAWRRARRAGTGAVGVLALAVAVPLIWRAVDPAALASAWRALVASPIALAGVLAAYAGAFALRAWAWRRVLPDLRFGQALAAIHLALAGNHVLPLRLGEPLRVVSIVRRAGVPADAATSSTLTLRGADVCALGLLAAVLGSSSAHGGAGAWAWVAAGAGAAAAAAGVVWSLRQRARHGRRLRLPGPPVLAAAAAAWLLEAAVLWQAAAWAGVALSPGQAALVSVMAVAGQIAAVAPSGVGTYEAAGTAALFGLGVDAATGLAVVVTAHAVKTAYALVAGAVAFLLPTPGMPGRLRLPHSRPVRPAPRPADPGAPVVLFLPAHDEEATVGSVVARVPAAVHGHPVSCLVVDDGSTDRTAEAAAAAGATVVSLGRNQGLGAAVRHGLSEALRRAPAAVAFCDADGEYAPEDLGRLVGPILAGEADYVVGSRFSGRIHRMLPHRRVGNLVLTRLLAFAARERISDGQSGFRALSPEAAAAAEIVHDYNYAQVLTLDLLARGFRYAEVPIDYRFREHGRSFVRLGRYLSAVVPAALRVVNRDLPPATAER